MPILPSRDLALPFSQLACSETVLWNARPLDTEIEKTFASFKATLLDAESISESSFIALNKTGKPPWASWVTVVMPASSKALNTSSMKDFLSSSVELFKNSSRASLVLSV